MPRALRQRPPAAIAAIPRSVALHAISVRAGFPGTEAVEQPALEIGRHGVLQLLGFVMDFVPFHAENLGEHALNQVMAIENAVGYVASGRCERELAVAARL